MNNAIKLFSSFYGSKIIHQSMDNNINIKSTDEKIIHTFEKDKKYFLYIHIPFCSEFCSFCNFHKFKYTEEKANDYFKSLKLEILKLSDLGLDFDNLYIGGGTPLISHENLLETIKLCKRLFNIDFISCETTPSHIQVDVLKKFEGLIDRLSVGVQTFDNDTLKKFGRYNKYGSSEELQEKISAIVGILPIISLDLIFNFPEQEEQALKRDLQIAKSLKVDQVVTYPYMSSVFKDSTFLENIKSLKNSKEFTLYEIIREELKDYHMNNSWSFSKEEIPCSDEYVVDHSEYIGVGSGAFTYINNKLYVNSYDLDEYHNKISNHTNAIIAKTDSFTLKNKMRYHLLIKLFAGKIIIDKFNEEFKVDIESILKKELFLLKAINAITVENNVIAPTSIGNYLTLVMNKEFYSGMDLIRKKIKTL